jgi:hypothetical protein
MKLLLTVFLFIKLDAYADTTIYKMKVLYDCPLFKEPSITSKQIRQLKGESYVFVIGRSEEIALGYAKVVVDSIVGYCYASFLNMDNDEIKLLNNNNQEERIALANQRNKQLYIEAIATQIVVDKAKEKWGQKVRTLMKKHSLLIMDYEATVDDYWGGFSISFYNASPKTIKYVWVTSTAYNAVNDPIQTKKVKCVGPIKSQDNGTYEFDDIFLTRVLDEVRLQKIEVQYMDGTIRSYSKQAISEMIYDHLEEGE